MTINEIIPLILSTLGGGVLGGFLTFKISLKKQNLTEFEALINEYKTLYQDLQGRVSSLETELERIRDIERTQRGQIVMLQKELDDVRKEQ